jgi:hypothetical protein
LHSVRGKGSQKAKKTRPFRKALATTWQRATWGQHIFTPPRGLRDPQTTSTPTVEPRETLDMPTVVAHQRAVTTAILLIGRDVKPPPDLPIEISDADATFKLDQALSLFKATVGFLVHSHFPPTEANSLETTLGDRTVLDLIF